MHTIYSYGGGEYLFYIFNFVASLVTKDDGGISPNIIRLVALLGFTWAILLMYAKNSITPGLTWLLWFGLASFAIIGPKTTVYISDPIAYGRVVKHVDNVPLILAIGASSFSTIGHNLTEKIEATFRVPGNANYLKYIETGSLFGSKMIKKLQEVRVEDPTFNANLEKFVQQCVVYDAMIGRKYTMRDLGKSKDIWELVSSKASPVLGFLYKDEQRNEIVTCKEGSDLLKQKWDNETRQVATTQGKRRFSFKWIGEPEYNAESAKNAFLSKLQQSYKLFGGVSEDASKILQQQMMINVLREAPAKKANQLGDSYAVAKATLQQRNSYKISGLMAEESLVVMRAVFEALLYGSFVFVYILIFLPAGYRTLGYYFQGICWIQLWAPLYAILNFIMTLYGHYQTKAILGDVGLARMNSAALIDLHTDITALAGWLSLSVPYLSFMLVNKGGVSAFVHLANYFGSSMMSSISSAAADKTTGNISLGNYSQGITNFDTLSAYKYNTSSDFQSGQLSNNLASGATKVVNPDGSIVYLAGQGKTASTFSTDLSESKHSAMQLNKYSQQEKALMEDKAAEHSKQTISTERDLAELIDRAGNTQTNSTSYLNDEAFSKGKTLSNTIDFAKTLQKKFGLSHSSALEAAIGIGTARTGGGYKSSTGVNISRDEIKNFAESQGYKENLDSVMKSAKSLSFNDQQTKEKMLAQQISSSYEKAYSLRESMSIHKQKAERLGKNAAFMESSNFDKRTTLGQVALDYIANSPGINSKSRIGYDTAASIMDAKSGPLLDRQRELLGRFQEGWTREERNFFSKNEIKTEADLESAYNVINKNIMSHEPIKNHFSVTNRTDEVTFNNEHKDKLLDTFGNSKDMFTSKEKEFNEKVAKEKDGTMNKLKNQLQVRRQRDVHYRMGKKGWQERRKGKRGK